MSYNLYISENQCSGASAFISLLRPSGGSCRPDHRVHRRHARTRQGALRAQGKTSTVFLAKELL